MTSFKTFFFIDQEVQTTKGRTNTIKIDQSEFERRFEDNSDYFGDGFDDNKLCKEGDYIKNLKKEKKGVCVTANKGDDVTQWENCKKELFREMVEKCSGRPVLKVWKYNIFVCPENHWTECSSF